MVLPLLCLVFLGVLVCECCVSVQGADAFLISLTFVSFRAAILLG